jgi:protein-L-isoaspartate(D-aspartate) O-methyltransferase
MDTSLARSNMVEGQVRTNKVIDPTLIDALRRVPRELFVPAERRAVAYVDADLPLGGGRWLMEPMVLARMIQALEAAPGARVLEVAGATGYGAAVMAAMGLAVVTCDPDPAMTSRATQALEEAGLGTATAVTGPIAEGHPVGGAFDAILVAGAVATLPPGLLAQLRDGGRLVAVLRPAGAVGRATSWTRIGGVASPRPLFDAASPYLPGMAPEPAFAL